MVLPLLFCSAKLFGKEWAERWGQNDGETSQLPSAPHQSHDPEVGSTRRKDSIRSIVVFSYHWEIH